MVFGSFVRAKVLAIVLASVAIIGGGTAVFAATPAGQSALHNLTGLAHSSKGADNAQNDGANAKNCAGDDGAKGVLAEFSLSADAKSDSMQAVCDLHAGNFKGKTPAGADVSSSRVFGYGEIEKLLTYANYLAGHDSTNNPSGKMTDANARAYLAAALQSCGSTPLEKCLMNNIPGFHPGNGSGNNGSDDNGTNGKGRPDETPTPPPHP